ncbi:hypothetical protein FC48_GL000942 [Ligilactobacillus murinus DSM 20452 = NBRC 14221]|uniref:Uncharacterized protein n=1 Tax=Ligilactobacillus murinus DSM 20452 = NBRC 14221 TaxID=1423772 RepID=A0A0R2B2J3_9LACO|nr:hypothetical protein [Ligilactobacillus murinus]KRM73672.1 hypothetical protein FC48_GL000942 [Ligilactobacillus murinus DSM 20452 = NBRC 14221]WOY88153.1 hypothetical protein R7892_05510 [Ligilactobacillus murinus]
MNKEQKRQAELIKGMLETFKSEGYTDIIITASKFGGGSQSDVVIANQGTVLGLAELLVGMTMRLPSEIVDLATNIQEKVVTRDAD